MQSLGQAIALMSDLRTLECFEVDADALGSVLHHVARSSNIHLLKVSHTSFPPSLDLSLSECVRHQNAIVNYTLCTRQNYSGKERQQHALPKFIEALKTNYTVQKVTLDGPAFEWDSDCKANVETLVRLNVAGRERVAMDPANKRKSIDVLNQVSEDMDCIFTHLCENPFICGGTPMLANGKSK